MKDLNAKLASLGMALIAKKSNISADPECTILELLPLLCKERKLLSLLLGWLDKYGDLVHVQRLKALSSKLSAEELAWLGGIALKANEKDSRWNVVAQYAKKQLGSKVRFEVEKLDSLLAKRKGADPHFEQFGLHIPIVLKADEKKLFQRPHILRNHPWLRLRALFGANWRADIAYQMLQVPDVTPYRVSKVLGCNIETAYRNWKALEEANARDALAI